MQEFIRDFKNKLPNRLNHFTNERNNILMQANAVGVYKTFFHQWKSNYVKMGFLRSAILGLIIMRTHYFTILHLYNIHRNKASNIFAVLEVGTN